MKTVWVYVDTAREVGDVDHLKVFSTEEAAEAWFTENDTEGVAFEYPVIEGGFNLSAQHSNLFAGDGV
jgi:hypothetical protein